MNYFEELAKILIQSGTITFFVPFLLSFSFFFALFEKIKLSDKKSLNAILAFSISLLILTFPLISGVDIGAALSYYFAQAFGFLIVIIFGFLISSLFYPDFSEKLKNFFTTRGVLASMIALAITLFVTSGLLNLLFLSFNLGQYGASPTITDATNVAILTALLLIFVIILTISGRLR